MGIIDHYLKSEIEKAINEFGDMVYRLAFSYCQNKPDADDVFQEVFLKYIKAAPAFENNEHQKAWLIRVTINSAKSELMSFWKRNVFEMSEEMGFSEPEEQSLAESLKRLPRKYRIVLHLHYFEGYSTAEIAILLGKKPSTIRTQLTRAREQLSRLVEEDEKCLKVVIEE